MLAVLPAAVDRDARVAGRHALGALALVGERNDPVQDVDDVGSELAAELLMAGLDYRLERGSGCLHGHFPSMIHPLGGWGVIWDREPWQGRSLFLALEARGVRPGRCNGAHRGSVALPQRWRGGDGVHSSSFFDFGFHRFQPSSTTSNLPIWICFIA